MKCGIYMIKCKATNKVYIGQSRNVKSRFKSHLYELRKKKHKNKYLINSFDNFGRENFQFNILETCKEEKLNEREVYWINFYKSYDPEFGFNLRKHGYNKTTQGFPAHSEEDKKKTGEQSKQRWQDPEWANNCRASIKKTHEVRKAEGNPAFFATEKGLEKVKELNETIFASSEHRQKLSERALKQMYDPNYRPWNLENLKKARASEKRTKNLAEFNEKQRTDEEHKKRQAEHARQAWLDPEKRAKRIEAIRKSRRPKDSNG